MWSVVTTRSRTREQRADDTHSVFFEHGPTQREPRSVQVHTTHSLFVRTCDMYGAAPVRSFTKTSCARPLVYGA